MHTYPCDESDSEEIGGGIGDDGVAAANGLEVRPPSVAGSVLGPVLRPRSGRVSRYAGWVMSEFVAIIRRINLYEI